MQLEAVVETSACVYVYVCVTGAVSCVQGRYVLRWHASPSKPSKQVHWPVSSLQSPAVEQTVEKWASLAAWALATQAEPDGQTPVVVAMAKDTLSAAGVCVYMFHAAASAPYCVRFEQSGPEKPVKQVHSLDGPQVPCLEHELGQFCARASAVRLASRSRSSSSIGGAAAAGPRWCRLMMAKDRPCQACRGGRGGAKRAAVGLRHGECGCCCCRGRA